MNVYIVLFAVNLHFFNQVVNKHNAAHIVQLLFVQRDGHKGGLALGIIKQPFINFKVQNQTLQAVHFRL